jgi:hypothetical protein
MTLVLPYRPMGTMLELIVLPPIRVPETRPGRQTRLHRDANVEAILAQIPGQVNVSECAHYAQRNRVWASCVSVIGALLGSCSNCHYNNEGSCCSLHKYSFQSVFALSKVITCLQVRGLMWPPLLPPTPMP